MGRFYFSGLNRPVRARVTHQDAAGMTLRQELPFLEINGKLRDEEGREGSLENVSVCVRNGVPSLVLDIRYDDGRRDATVPFLMESTRAMRATKGLLDKVSAALPAPDEPERRKRRDETLPYGIKTGLNAGFKAGADAPAPQSVSDAPTLPSVEELLKVTSAPLAPRPVGSKRNGWWMRMWRSLVALFG